MAAGRRRAFAFFFLIVLPPPRSTLFPYTTLFRSFRDYGRNPLDWLLGKLFPAAPPGNNLRSEEHTSELQSRPHLVCRLLLEKKKTLKSSSTQVSKGIPNPDLGLIATPAGSLRLPT